MNTASVARPQRHDAEPLALTRGESRLRDTSLTSSGLVGVTVKTALAYHNAGYRVIPIKRGTKKPSVRNWKQFQTSAPTEEDLRQWFGGKSEVGIAIILGEASGGLVCRDFDEAGSYDRWAAKYPELAAKLPTVATSPGRGHVYFRSTHDTLARARHAMGSKSQGYGAIVLRDGELRGASGCYCVAPPSVHPNGHRYCWNGLEDGDVPKLNDIPVLDDIVMAGLVDHATQRDTVYSRNVCSCVTPVCSCVPPVLHALSPTATPPSDEPDTGSPCDVESKDELDPRPCHSRDGQASCQSSASVEAVPRPEEIEGAIERTLPVGPGRRHEQVFRLARALKSIPSLEGDDLRRLEPYVREWHRRALPYMTTKDFTETWIDFLKAWPNVRFKEHEGALQRAWEVARSAAPPAVAMAYDNLKLRTLVTLCRELQRLAGEAAFFLSCRSVASFLDVKPSTASRWFFLLGVEGILREVSKGTQITGKASEFFYLGPLDEANDETLEPGQIAPREAATPP